MNTTSWSLNTILSCYLFYFTVNSPNSGARNSGKNCGPDYKKSSDFPLDLVENSK